MAKIHRSHQVSEFPSVVVLARYHSFGESGMASPTESQEFWLAYVIFRLDGTLRIVEVNSVRTVLQASD